MHDTVSVPATGPAAVSQDSVGGHLKRLRQEHRLSIAETAEQTKISTTTLQALENGEYNKLPADTFTRGLLAKYADFLGTNREALIEDFFRERETRLPGRLKAIARRNNIPLQPVRLAEPVHISSAMVAGLLLLGIIVTFTAFCLYTSWNPFSFMLRRNETSAMPYLPLPGTIPPQANGANQTVMQGDAAAPMTDDERKLLVAAIAEAIAADVVTLPQSQGATYRLELEQLRPGQLEISIDGGLWTKQELKVGEKQQYLANTSLQLRYDLADSVRLSLNGASVNLPPPGADGRHLLSIPEEAAR